MSDRSRPQRLAIVGASVRAAAQSAVRAGFEVVGADLFADADSDGVCPVTTIDDYPDGFASWLASEDVDAWMYTGALENYPDLVDQMASIKPLWGVSGESLRRCRDPLVLQSVLGEAGIAFPETLSLGKMPSSDGEWLAKSYRHAAGAGVWRFGEQPSDAGPVFAQRLASGDPLAAVFAVSPAGTGLLGLSQQLMPKSADDGFGYRGSIGPITPTAAQADCFGKLGKVLSGLLGLRGLIGVDLLVDGDTVTVVEINPRYTASVEVLERALQFSKLDQMESELPPAYWQAIACHAAACRGEAVDDWRFGTWGEGGAAVAGKQIVFAKHDVTISEAWSGWALDEAAKQQLADAPRAGEFIPAGRPVCTVLALGAMAKPMRGALRSRVAEVERRLYAATS